mmetsp:Transcript_16646/g.52421  ORF Transcript_16646/g.52421 Transcript_16646/m.52421 type:complete len:96 (+) Transcript_16646:735-1022(+)
MDADAYPTTVRTCPCESPVVESHALQLELLDQSACGDATACGRAASGSRSKAAACPNQDAASVLTTHHPPYNAFVISLQLGPDGLPVNILSTHCK